MITFPVIILTKEAKRIAVLSYTVDRTGFDLLDQLMSIAKDYLNENNMTIADHAFFNGEFRVWID